jgi:hypothetical protein
MSVLIYFLLSSTIPYLSTGLDTYGIIRNASIKIPFDINDKYGYKLEAESCNQCLCNAFNNSSVVLFTCTQKESKNCICQFYYFMPKRDEIQYPIYDTSIYLINISNTFEEKDDCCNTTYLLQAMNKTIAQKYFKDNHFRSIVEGDNNTIVAVISKGTTTLLKFDKSTLENIDDVPDNIPSLKAVGYYDKKYYLGTADKKILVYSENLTTLLDSINIKYDINTIRFLNSTQEMLVGTSLNGVYRCGKAENDTIPKNCIPILSTQGKGQVHAIGVVNESAFYVGWYAPGQNIHLYRRDQNNNWTTNDDDRINHKEQISDIFIDDCKRIWAVTAESGEITIYDQNKSALDTINLFGSKLFNLIILANYTLIGSHGSDDGIWRIQPPLNCRPPR